MLLTANNAPGHHVWQVKKPRMLGAAIRQKKSVLFPGNPIDPTFFGPTLNFFGTSENFSSNFKVKTILSDFHACFI